MEALIRAGINDIEEILTKVLLHEVGNANNNINNININKTTIIRGPKKEVYI